MSIIRRSLIAFLCSFAMIRSIAAASAADPLTTVMGHADYSMKCIGFQTIVARGAEWVATGKVAIPVPKDFPTAEKTASVAER